MQTLRWAIIHIIEICIILNKFHTLLNYCLVSSVKHILNIRMYTKEDLYIVFFGSRSCADYNFLYLSYQHIGVKRKSLEKELTLSGKKCFYCSNIEMTERY